jgi:tRNA nucleotidyltransferase (CCA-adding enzyme)
MNLFNMLSGPRLFEELRLSFHETEPIRTLKRLSDFGLLKVIHANLLFTEELEATLKSLQEALSWFNLLFLEEETDKGVLYLMALLSGLKDEDVKAALERLLPPPRMRDAILKGISDARRVLRKFPTDDPVEVYKVFSSLTLEIILFVMALSKDRRKQRVISYYLTELRDVRTILKGDSLKKMGIQPGPAYTRILRQLLEERLRGHVTTREDEEKFVKQILQG